MMILGFLVFLFYLSLSNAVDAVVTCLHCGNVASPRDCRDIMICGKGEICYTREFTDHRGLQAFSLGCEAETRCNLFLNAQQIFGKRDDLFLDPAPSDLCYACCKSEECNERLCQGNGGAHVPQAPSKTTPCPTCSCLTIAHQEGSGSPPFSIAYKDKYYFFSYSAATWHEARAFCKNYGADLVSINSQEEQEFLNQHSNITGCKHDSGTWTGGAYSHSLHEWEWVDRFPVLYTHWASGYPGTLSHTTDYHIAMFNPSCHSPGEPFEGRWFSYSASQAYHFICEKRKM